MAIKVFARGADRDETTERLLAALRSRRHLRHPNVVHMIEVGDADSGAFALMEYIPGETLSGLHRLSIDRDGAALPRAVAMRILVDALDGLDAVHSLVDEHGRPLHLVHRGFAARKILVGTDGVARLADFAASMSSASSLPGSGPVAPELSSPVATDRRVDVWAAGLVAWEILTGRTPETGAALPSPKSIAGDLSDELDALIVRALHPDREQRPASVGELTRELASAARSAGLLADTNLVASHVTRLVGPELSERKELLAQARRHPKRPSAPDVRTMIGMAGPLPTKRAPLPSLPDLPPAPNDFRSELRIEVPLGRPVERAGSEIFGHVGAPVADEPEIFRSPVVIDDGAGAAPPLAAAPSSPPVPFQASAPMLASGSVSVIPGVSPRPSVGAIVRPWVSPPWTTKKLSTLAGVAGGFLGFVLVLVAVSGRSKPDPEFALLSSNAGAALAAPPVLAKAASTITTDPTDAPASPSSADEDADSALLVKANGPMASVTVDGRVVRPDTPSTSLRIDLHEKERGRPVHVSAKAVDGRVASGTAASGANELRLTFGDKARSRPGTSPASTTKRPWSKRH